MAEQEGALGLNFLEILTKLLYLVTSTAFYVVRLMVFRAKDAFLVLLLNIFSKYRFSII